MVKVPIWEPNISDLPGASKYPAPTPDAFGAQIGEAQAQAGRAIGTGLATLGGALTEQGDEQEAIKSKVALSDHETAVQSEVLRLKSTTPASEAYKIPDMINTFAQNDWATRGANINPKFKSIADANAHVYWNKIYTQEQATAVATYGDAVGTQIKSETARQGMAVFANPDAVPSATSAIRAYVDETHLPLEIKRGMLVEAAAHFQSQIIAGYKLRIQNAEASGNITEAIRLQKEAAELAVSLPKTLSKSLGIDALPKPVAPPIMLPQQPLPMPGSVKTPVQKMSMVTQSDTTPSAPQDNFKAAKADLNLTPQETDLYQRHLTNLVGPGGVTNSDGSRSTLFIATSTFDDGKTYLIPTVWDGKLLNVQQATERAKNEGLSKFPSYPTQDEAEARYTQMHDYMDKDTGQYLLQQREKASQKRVDASGTTFSGSGKYGPQATPSAAANVERPMRIGGTMTVEGNHYTFGSGGAGYASIPYGTYPVTPEVMGDWGRAHGALGINYNRIADPKLGRFREGIELHAGSGNMPITKGCVAIAGGEYPKFKAQVLGMIQKYGTVFLSVGPGGATITPTKDGKITNASYKQEEFVPLPKVRPLSDHDTRLATTGPE